MLVCDWTAPFCQILGASGMGRAVDEHLQVKSLHGLSVLDVSVIPTMVSGIVMAQVKLLYEDDCNFCSSSQSTGLVV